MSRAGWVVLVAYGAGAAVMAPLVAQQVREVAEPHDDVRTRALAVLAGAACLATWPLFVVGAWFVRWAVLHGDADARRTR